MVVSEGAEMSWRQHLLFVLLLLAALMVGVSGMSTLPPDEHEILVLRTSQEMAARGDWIVPYFNDEPRLKKPPLSYWLTGLTAFVAGADGQIVAWHGRLPSLFAGLAIAAMLWWAGQRFYSTRAAWYGCALFVSSVGFFTFSHDGRPDFLYAALCTAGWLAGAVALVEARGARLRPVVLMWLAFAFATLAKGPHIPFMLLVAMALFCVSREPRGSLSPRVLRPLLGVALVAAIAVPWWLALHARLDPSAVRGSQLAGRLLVPRLDHLFNGYYLYRPLQLLLPWLPLVPVAWLAAARQRDGSRDFTVYLALCTGAVILGLSLGVQQRFFYLLPVMPALCLLAGHGLACLETQSPRLALALVGVQALVVVAAAGWLFVSQQAPGALALLVCVATLVALSGARLSGSICVGAVLLAALLAVGSFARFADGPVLWSIARFHRHELAAATAKLVGSEQALFSYVLTPVLYIQVTGRAIPEFPSLVALERAMHERQLERAYVLTLLKRRAELAQRFEVQELALMPAKANDRAGLFLVTPRHP